MTALISHRLQEAIFQILKEDQTLQYKITGIYDQAPPNVVFPYLTFGETSAQAADLKDRAGVSISLTVSVWSIEASQMEAKELMADVDAILNQRAIEVPGVDCSSLHLDAALVQRQFSSAKVLYQGRLNYRCVCYEA